MNGSGTISRRGVLAAALAGAASVTAGGRETSAQTSRGAAAMMRGVNLAGAEFGTTMPGQFGKDYLYPDAANFQRFAAMGFDLIRLPFRWERLQPDLERAFDEAEWARLAGAIAAARHNRQTIILDMHNYARRKVRDDGFRTEHMIGSAQVPADAFAACWRDLVGRVRDEPHVLLGIMNEPADIQVEAWVPIADRAVAAIRKAGSRQMILLPGIDWTGAHSWYASGNTLMENVRDPTGNMAIEVHQYIDSDSSGRSGNALSPTIGSERLEAFQEWARARRFKALLGEFGGGAGPSALAALADMIAEIEANPDVWIGWAGWAAGPWWPPDEPLRLEPDAKGNLPPQTRVLADFTRPSTEPSGRIAGSAIDLDFVRQRFHGVNSPSDVLVARRDGAALALQRNGSLRSFEQDTPCITDLGLHMSPSIVATSVALGPVVPVTGKLLPAGRDVLPPSYPTWELLAGAGPVPWPGAVRGEGGEIHVHVKWNPLAAGILVIASPSSRAEIDLARWQVRMVAGNVAVSVSGSGEWRRIARKSAEPVTLELRAAAGERMLVATTYAVIRPGSSRHEIVGAPARTMATLEGTLMIETRAGPGTILLAGGKLLLSVRWDNAGNGQLECSMSRRAVTAPIAWSRWQERRRCLLSISKRSGRIVLATTGAAPVVVDGALPAIEGPFVLGNDGIVTRMATFTAALSAAQAGELVG